MSAALDLTGQTFARLTVVCLSVGPRKQQTYWLCRCACGTTVTTLGWALRSGHVKSCGCLRSEVSSRKATTHGLGNHWLKSTFDQMMSRCYEESHKAYHNYGGRGIRVHESIRTLPEFIAFVEKELGLRPQGHTLERKCNNIGYDPGNLGWATHSNQLRNTRVNRLLTFKGRTLCVAAWAEETGITYTTLSARINRLGWSVDRALTTKVGET